MSFIREALKKVYKSKPVRQTIKYGKKISNAKKKLSPALLIWEVLTIIKGEDNMRQEVVQTFKNIRDGKPFAYGGDLSNGDIPEWIKQDKEKDKPKEQQNQPKEVFNRENNNHNNRKVKDIPIPIINIEPTIIFDIDIDIDINTEQQINNENINTIRPELPYRNLTTTNTTFNQNVKLDLKHHKFGCLLNDPISSTPIYLPDCPIESFDELLETIDNIEDEMDDVIEWLGGFSYGELFKHGIALIEIQYRTIQSVTSYSLFLFSRETIQKLSNYYAARNNTANFPIITKIHDDIRLFTCSTPDIYVNNSLKEFHIYRTEQLLDDLSECHIPLRNFKNYKPKGEGYRKQLQIIFINEEGLTKDLTIPNPIDILNKEIILESIISDTWYFGHAKFELNFNEWGYLRHYGDNDEDISVKERFISIANNLSKNTIVINSFRKSIRTRDFIKGFYTAYKAVVIYAGDDKDNDCTVITL